MERKISIIKLGIVLFIHLFCFSLCSCDNEEEGGSDPEGTITVKIRNRDNGGNDFELFNEIESVKISKANNFYWTRYYSNTIVRFVDVGNVKGLSSVNNIPASGWSQEVAVLKNHGYVARRTFTDGPNIQYARFYVDTYIESASTGGIIGAVIKYQPLWK